MVSELQACIVNAEGNSSALVSEMRQQRDSCDQWSAESMPNRHRPGGHKLAATFFKHCVSTALLLSMKEP